MARTVYRKRLKDLTINRRLIKYLIYLFVLIFASILLFATTTETASKEQVALQSCLEPICKADLPDPEPPTVKEMIRREARLAGHPADVMIRIAEAESDFRPHAKNPDSTATGVFQIIIGTWNWLDCTGERTNARDNIKCAMKIADDGLHHWEESADEWKI